MVSGTAQETEPLTWVVLPSVPESVACARAHVRVALARHGLGHCAGDAEIVTSELVTNAIKHVISDITEKIAVTLTLLDPGELTVSVWDSSPTPPVRSEPEGGTEHGRGLQVVDALSVLLGWRVIEGHRGKQVFAVIRTEK